MSSPNKDRSLGFKVVGLREHNHGDTIEELAVSSANIDEVFVKMRDAVMAEVTDADGQSRIVVCREAGGNKMILLLEPLNERATAETLSPKAFAMRFTRVKVSYNAPKKT